MVFTEVIKRWKEDIWMAAQHEFLGLFVLSSCVLPLSSLDLISPSANRGFRLEQTVSNLNMYLTHLGLVKIQILIQRSWAGPEILKV